MRCERIYVDPEFKKRLKVESASNGQTVIEFTKALARSQKSLLQIDSEVNLVEQKPKRFSFRI